MMLEDRQRQIIFPEGEQAGLIPLFDFYKC